MSTVANLTNFPAGGLAAGVNFALAVAALAILYMLYRDYRVDKVRDEIFALRDKLFDFACKNDLLDHAGYILLRQIMNSMLRFAHKITFLRFGLVLILAGSARPNPNPLQEWKAALATLPRERAEILEEFHVQMWRLALTHMCDTSTIMRIIRCAFWASKYVNKMREPAVSIFLRMRGVEQIEAQAFTFSH